MSKSRELINKAKALTEHLAKTATAPQVTAGEEGPPWLGQVAMLTGVLAALTGFLTVRSTTLTNEAIYESNQAILSQTQASDAWAEYQANSIKAHIVEMQLLPSSTLNAQDRTALKSMEDDFRNRQPASKQSASDKIKERQAHLDEGLKKLQAKDLLGYAGMAAQLGIALASVAALVHKKVVFHAGILAGIAAVVITAYVFVLAYLAG